MVYMGDGDGQGKAAVLVHALAKQGSGRGRDGPRVGRYRAGRGGECSFRRGAVVGSAMMGSIDGRSVPCARARLHRARQRREASTTRTWQAGSPGFPMQPRRNRTETSRLYTRKPCATRRCHFHRDGETVQLWNTRNTSCAAFRRNKKGAARIPYWPAHRNGKPTHGKRRRNSSHRTVATSFRLN